MNYLIGYIWWMGLERKKGKYVNIDSMIWYMYYCIDCNDDIIPVYCMMI